MTDAADTPSNAQPDNAMPEGEWIARFGSTVITSLPPVEAKPGDPLPGTSAFIRVLAGIEEPTTPTLRSAPQFSASCRQIAVLYLRVSTRRQLDTAIDIDPDGNSIATQRELGHRRAVSLGATVVKEFVEPHSAKTVDDRKVFREVLTYLHANPSIKYLIVYMRSRAFRNRFDAAIVETQLKKIGVRVISVKEDFGDGPHAVAMEGMMDIMNDLQNTLQGLDIQTKMRNKAINGGTIGRAKLGYLNVRVDYEGKQINTIALDPVRAPLVLKAWELYASGDYATDDWKQRWRTWA